MVFLLTVDLHQSIPQVPQLGHVDRVAVDETPPGAVTPEDSPQNQFVPALQIPFPEPGENRAAIRQAESAPYLGFLLALLDQSLFPPSTQQDAQRIHEQRLAGTRFAGDGGESRTELQLHFRCDGEVADGQPVEHQPQPSLVLSTSKWSCGSIRIMDSFLSALVRRRVSSPES